MNKKGFTLIELMGVLVILSILMLMAVPSITKTLNGTSANELDEYHNTLCMAAQSYIEVELGGAIPTNIPIANLRDKGYVNKDFKNPDTDELDTGVIIIKTKTRQLTDSTGAKKNVTVFDYCKF